MVGVVPTVALALAAGSHNVTIGPGNNYSPKALNVTQGDTVTWQASSMHPLVFDDGSGRYESSHARTLDTPGVVAYHCEMHVASGMTGTVSVNGLPTIAIERDTASPRIGGPVSFHANASDADGTVAQVDWDLDDDGSFERSGATASATFPAGSHTVRARATDNLGASAAATHTFTVPGSSETPPPGSSGDKQAPKLDARAPSSIAARKLRRRGVKLTLTASEDGRFVAVLRNRRGHRLGRKTAAAHAGQASVIRVRARRAKAGRLKLRIAAIDLAGNRTAIGRRLDVR